MGQGEIDAIRALLSAKPRPVGWAERRQRLDEVGSVWPAATDVKLEPVDLGGVPGEWSSRRRQRRLPRSDVLPWRRLLLRLHPQPSSPGDRGRSVSGDKNAGGGYRLAPEHPFPAAMEDALTAWRFLRQQGIAARHIAIGGDSAGGGLAVVLNNRLRDADEELPGCVWLVSPWTDLTMSGSTLITKDNVDPIIHKGYLGELADAYVPPGMGRKNPRVSPLYADLKGLPPMLVQVGSAETLLEDATRFAAAAGAADVSVTLEIWPHMIHAWPMWNARLKPGRSALAHAGAFMRAHL